MATIKSISRKFLIGFLVIVLLMGFLPTHPAFAAPIFNVNSALDQIDDDTSDGVCHTAANTCTLRAAIMQANKMTGPSVTINLPAGTYTLTRSPLGANGDNEGDLNLTAPLTGGQVISIIGAGASTTIIDANQIDRVFFVDASRNASISGVTIRNGYAQMTLRGGGIYNSGTLTVTNSTISDNFSDGSGGGLFNDGTLTVTNSTISGNSADFGGGGGLFNDGTLTVTNSTISGNSADLGGGGIYNEVSLIVVNSTISGNNTVYNGGGIYNILGSTNVYNTTILFNDADSDVNNSGSGGGVFNHPSTTAFNLINTLVANNYKSFSSLDDCTGTLASYGGNLFWYVDGDCTITNASGSWAYLNSMAFVGPLQNNGGPTLTHALLPGSNAIDNADPTLGCIDSGYLQLPTDQRGAARVSGNWCDIGAYERHPTLNVKSTGATDGWLLESTETSGVGGTMNATTTTFNLGDNAQDKQYRVILHFDTSSLPDDAVITKATLKIKKQGLVGTDPFTILGGLKVDVRKPSFGAVALAVTDFQATAGKASVATFNATPLSNWYSALLNAVGRNYINKTGATQFRLQFAIDDNDNGSADYLRFFSGDHATASVRPTLIIEYYVP